MSGPFTGISAKVMVDGYMFSVARNCGKSWVFVDHFMGQYDLAIRKYREKNGTVPGSERTARLRKKRRKIVSKWWHDYLDTVMQSPVAMSSMESRCEAMAEWHLKNLIIDEDSEVVGIFG